MTAPRQTTAPGRAKPPWGRLLQRGIRKHCPNCGVGRIYDTWFRMKERCPRCGLRFEREPGFFVGAYLINFAIAIVLLFVLCMAFVAWKASHPDAGPAAWLVAGVPIAVVGPLFFYPYSRTVWSAIDLGMTPLEADELADAAAHADHAEPVETVAPVDEP